MKKIMILFGFLFICFTTFSQNINDKKLITSFISDLSSQDKVFTIGMLSNYFLENYELEGSVLTHHFEKIGLNQNIADDILKISFEKGDSMPSFAILFLRNRNIHSLKFNDVKELSIVKYNKNDKMYKSIYKVSNILYPDEYVLFCMNSHPDKCFIIDIKDKKFETIFK